jgi:hypothetical protein
MFAERCPEAGRCRTPNPDSGSCWTLFQEQRAEVPSLSILRLTLTSFDCNLVEVVLQAAARLTLAMAGTERALFKADMPMVLALTKMRGCRSFRIQNARREGGINRSRHNLNSVADV